MEGTHAMSRIVAIMMALVVCGLATAAELHVPADYTTIQAAVDVASNGDEILVAPGTYTGTGDEVVDTLGKAITIKASGTPEETIIDGEGARRVVQCAGGEGADTIIEGFTITGGSANYGGGIRCSQSSPTITDCTISGNTADLGGGISCHNSSPTITGCTITNNTANNEGYGGGGGIYCFGGSPTISGCTISDNTAYWGGGIYVGGSSPTITDCTISNNTANSGGGGVSCNDYSSPTITGCTISWNHAWDGGGVYCVESSPTITGCTISGNTANDDGGGIYCYWDSSPTITDCTISNNTANWDGGGIFCWDSSPTITGCTISGNTAGGLGGGLYAVTGDLTSIQDTSICSNVPAESQVFGDYTDNGGNTIAEVCPWYQGACCTGNDLACVVATEEDCEYFGLTWLGEGTTCDDAPCPIACLGDVTGDGEVSINDVLTVIANWGPCP